MKPVLVFDIAETILDLQALSPVFTRIFGDPSLLRTWFDELVLYSEALTLTGGYADAGKVGVAVLEMLGQTRGVAIKPEGVAALKQASGAMPAYSDVPIGLARLRDAGFRMVTLSNNPTTTCEAQLTQAGIRPFFERVFSVDDQVKRYKPARESYLSVSAALGVKPADLCLVSCHAFDTLGAAAAGLQTALILRPGNAPFALGPQPIIVAADLERFSRTLIERHVAR